VIVDDKAISALDPASGRVRWQRSIETARLLLHDRPLIRDGTILVASTSTSFKSPQE
jgi:outer membrane protein assembly factor BamB